MKKTAKKPVKKEAPMKPMMSKKDMPMKGMNKKKGGC